MRGADGKIHSTTLDASSLYDAAAKATEAWARLWWFSPTEQITVRHGEENWNVSQDRLRQWQKAQ